MAAGLAVAVVTLAALGALPSSSSAGGAGACLRLPQARMIFNTDQAVIVRSRPRRAYYGCLKRQGRAIRIGSPDRVYDIGHTFAVNTVEDSCGVRLGDERVEPVDERRVAAGFVVPAAVAGVCGERLRVDALGGEDGEHGGL